MFNRWHGRCTAFNLLGVLHVVLHARNVLSQFVITGWRKNMSFSNLYKKNVQKTRRSKSRRSLDEQFITMVLNTKRSITRCFAFGADPQTFEIPLWADRDLAGFHSRLSPLNSSGTVRWFFSGRSPLLTSPKASNRGHPIKGVGRPFRFTGKSESLARRQCVDPSRYPHAPSSSQSFPLRRRSFSKSLKLQQKPRQLLGARSVRRSTGYNCFALLPAYSLQFWGLYTYVIVNSSSSMKTIIRCTSIWFAVQACLHSRNL